ncbi:MAG: hypothetical protein ABJN69_04340 [Hellea sp.]
MTACSGLEMEAPALTEETAELETLLAEMPWVSESVSSETSNDKVVYQFSFRTCPPCIQFKKEAWPILEEVGIETRLVMTARRRKSTEDERTAVVELARSRDWDMAEAWMRSNSPNGYYKKMTFPVTDGNAPREAELEKLRGQIDLLDDILAVNGIEMAYPTVLWQDAENVWRAEIGYYSDMAQDIITSMGVNEGISYK